MGTTARSLIVGMDPDELVANLDGLHAYEMAAAHWTLAVQSRLEGMALVLLNEELGKRASAGLANAGKLADRIAQLGGAPTGDPTRFMELSPVEAFNLPANCADIPTILASALAYERVFVDSYWRLCSRVREADPVTYDDLLHLLKDHVKREADLEAASGKLG